MRIPVGKWIKIRRKFEVRSKKTGGYSTWTLNKGWILIGKEK